MMDGLLIVNKDINMTSHDVVNIARKALKTKKIGHTGTLDPNATGVLVLAVGRATKLMKYFLNDNKTYIAEFLIGKAYDTDDVTGKLVAEKTTKDLSLDTVKNKLLSYLGESEQLPPDYSAVKIDGKKLYELARKNQVIDNKKLRKINIEDIKIFDIKRIDDTILLKTSLTVSKGTYIRSIARDLGYDLDNYGTLFSLVRTKVNEFSLEDANTISELKSGNFTLKSPFEYLDLPRITVSKNIEDEIEHGRFLDLKYFKAKKDTIVYSETNEPLAIYFYDETINKMRMSVKWRLK